VLILKGVKAVCFDTLLQVLILKVLTGFTETLQSDGVLQTRTNLEPAPRARRAGRKRALQKQKNGKLKGVAAKFQARVSTQNSINESASSFKQNLTVKIAADLKAEHKLSPAG
jgi:hypothetical protein